ncbi:MAG: hypothetical protein NXH73_04580 [Flavobacteriaceae bacterium]|nr:hypothetical protein [Flavobacteriaceae bacterium]
MKSKTFFVLFLFFGISPVISQAQDKDQSLIVTQNFWHGVRVYQEENQLSLRKTQELMASVPLALEEIKKARTNGVFSMVFGGLGGAFVGYPIGREIGGGDPEWIMAGIGAGLIAISIPFESAKFKRTKNAAALYNEHKGYAHKSNMNINFQVSGNSMGLVIGF